MLHYASVCLGHPSLFLEQAPSKCLSPYFEHQVPGVYPVRDARLIVVLAHACLSHKRIERFCGLYLEIGG